MFIGTIVGNLAADAELKYLADKKPVVNARVAANRKTKDGDVTTWVSISFFGSRAEKISGYLTKGKQIAVTGEVYNRSYQKDGVTCYSLELSANDIQLLGGGRDSTASSTTGDVAAKAAYVSTETSPF